MMMPDMQSISYSVAAAFFAAAILMGSTRP